jgi:hypothetical protein
LGVADTLKSRRRDAGATKDLGLKAYTACSETHGLSGSLFV